MKFCLMFCCLKFTVVFFHSCRGFNSVNKCFYCTRFCVDYENILHKLYKKLFFNRSFFGGFISRDDHAIFSLLRHPYFFAHNIGGFENFRALFYEHVGSSIELYLCYLQIFSRVLFKNLKKNYHVCYKITRTVNMLGKNISSYLQI